MLGRRRLRRAVGHGGGLPFARRVVGRKPEHRAARRARLDAGLDPGQRPLPAAPLRDQGAALAPGARDGPGCARGLAGTAVRARHIRAAGRAPRGRPAGEEEGKGPRRPSAGVRAGPTRPVPAGARGGDRSSRAPRACGCRSRTCSSSVPAPSAPRKRVSRRSTPRGQAGFDIGST